MEGSSLHGVICFLNKIIQTIKNSLGSLLKNGNSELRELLIHGLLAVVRCGANKTDTV